MANEVMTVEQLSNELAAVENELVKFKDLEARQKQLKEALLQAMLNNGIKSWKTNNNTLITVVDAIEPFDEYLQVFNERAFREDFPEIHKQYLEDKLKHNNGRKAYLKITANAKKEFTEDDQ